MSEKLSKEDYLRELYHIKAKDPEDGTVKDPNIHDGIHLTLLLVQQEDDPFKNSYTYEVEEHGSSDLTSCVGTRWFKYGQEIDLWSLGCIVAELFSLEPIFSGY
ncbi:hypothetical protein C5167_028804 [Papaver somniferum]|nr:hypothetical protein C5167_028804 [Papaver somniferum]